MTEPSTVLVVDDEEMIRSLLADALEDAGYRVLQAAHGRAALQVQRRTPADLLITDLVMPEQEGIETIEAFRRDFPAVKIIAISGAFEGTFLLVARHLGADAVLQKPVDPETIVETVARLLAPVN